MKDVGGNSKTIQMTDQGKKTLAEQLIKFSEIPGALSQDLLERLIATSDLKEFLRSEAFLIHKSCYSNFNNQKYQRALNRKRTSSDEGSNVVNVQPMKTRNRSGQKIEMGEQVCMHCGEPDKFNPKYPNRNKHMQLRAAAEKKPSSEHVQEMTEDLRTMAATLEDTKLLAQLSNDLRATECFYHTFCRTDFIRR